MKVLQLLVVNRLIAPGSEFRLHRQWFDSSAMDELLEVDFAVAGKDRLYRCLDRLLEHKEALCRFLTERWRSLFDAQLDVLLYDLTSTYFEGQCAEIPKGKFGHNRDGQKHCRQVVVALVVTPDGLPLAYEVLVGNTSDKSTLRDFLAKIESLYGKARRVWVMDRGIPTEQVLKEMRDSGTSYLVGTLAPRSTSCRTSWRTSLGCSCMRVYGAGGDEEGRRHLRAGPQRRTQREGNGDPSAQVQAIRARAARAAAALAPRNAQGRRGQAPEGRQGEEGEQRQERGRREKRGQRETEEASQGRATFWWAAWRC